MKVCRTCLKVLPTAKQCVPLDQLDVHSISLRDKLNFCEPGINLDIVEGSFLCESCSSLVTIAFYFKNLCTKTEGEICDFKKRNNSNVPGKFSVLDVVHQKEDKSTGKQVKERPDITSINFIKNIETTLNIEKLKLKSNAASNNSAMSSKPDPKYRVVMTKRTTPDGVKTYLEVAQPSTSKGDSIQKSQQGRGDNANRDGIKDKNKSFPCTMCTRTFAHEQSLKYHMMIHTGERPFRCEKCRASYIYEKKLKTHIKNAHGGK